jgi:hypothetical protein
MERIDHRSWENAKELDPLPLFQEARQAMLNDMANPIDWDEHLARIAFEKGVAAALATPRHEPTEAMIEAGRRAILAAAWTTRTPPEAKAVAVWTAMEAARTAPPSEAMA